MKLSILLYDYLTALDAIGPYEVLSRLPGVEVCSIAEKRGPRRALVRIARSSSGESQAC